MSFNEKIKRWFGFPLAATKMPSYLEEVQSVLEERLKELEMSEVDERSQIKKKKSLEKSLVVDEQTQIAKKRSLEKSLKKKAPVKKKSPVKKKATVKKKTSVKKSK